MNYNNNYKIIKNAKYLFSMVCLCSCYSLNDNDDKNGDEN